MSKDYGPTGFAQQLGLIKQLSVYSFQAFFEVEEALRLPPYKGATFRGAFGRALKETSCICSDSANDRSDTKGCPYHEIFEAAGTEQNTLWHFEQVPRPFLLVPPMDRNEDFHPGDKLSIGFTLFGRSIDHLPFVVLALDQMGRNGLGAGNKRVKLRQIFTVDEGRDLVNCIYSHRDGKLLKQHIKAISMKNVIPEADPSSFGEDASISVFFLTPARFQLDGGLCDRPVFEVVFASACRRVLSLLAYYHKVEIPDMSVFRTLIEESRKIRLVKSDVRWKEFERYSNRQQSRLKMGGIVGNAIYQGDLDLFIPWLKASEWTAVGKNPVFGLGQIRVRNGWTKA